MENSFEFKMVNTKHIIVSPKYQREVNTARVDKILSEFQPSLVNPPKLSYRDGKYYVFDGQHTLTVLKARNNNQDLPILCKVYEGLNEVDEAILFELQNGIVSTPSTAQKLRSAYNRGDETACAVVDTARSFGFIVDYTCCKGPNHISAVKSLYNIYTKMGAQIYLETLGLIKAAWMGKSDSLRKEILEGMSIFVKTYKGRYNRDLFIRKMAKVNPINIITDAKISTSYGSKKYAQRILAEYNKNLASSRLDDEL